MEAKQTTVGTAQEIYLIPAWDCVIPAKLIEVVCDNITVQTSLN